MNTILIIITTEKHIENAEKISKLLIDKKIAACISLKKINSNYLWKGEFHSTDEIEITIKSIPKNRELIINILKTELSYELPQIIFQEYNSDLDYFYWIMNNVN
tara:strand:+ start:1037 stop:1348 length:312 start_codon:yes stop_codon:yes gene_type:complete